MDQNNQNSQSQKEQSGGGINLGNLIPSGKIAGRTGTFATRAATTLGKFLFTTPAGWVALGICIILVFTFAIVFSLGAPPTKTDTNAVPTTNPTLTPPPAL